MTKATEMQVGGNHYKLFKIQPIEFAYNVQMNPIIFSAFKYVVRAPFKGQLEEDLQKCCHCLDLFEELHEKPNDLMHYVKNEYLEEFLAQFDVGHAAIIEAVLGVSHKNYRRVKDLVGVFGEAMKGKEND